MLRTLAFFVALTSAYAQSCGENEVFSICRSSSCWEKSCQDALAPAPEFDICTYDCNQGCHCADGFFRHNGACVSLNACQIEALKIDDDYNCNTREVWSDAKSEWCCQHHGSGCSKPGARKETATVTDPEFNCATRERWTPGKSQWCCENQGVGCSSDLLAPESSTIRACCMAFTADCLSCSKGVTIEKFCADPSNLDIIGCPQRRPPALKACCMAFTAECMACSENVAVEELCSNPAYFGIAGCPQRRPPSPKMCCMAFTADCLSCSEGVTVEEFCADPLNLGIAGCPERRPPAPKACCYALTADCLSCSEGATVEEFCADPSNLGIAGCPERRPPAPKACCMALTAECMACSMNLSVEALCAHSPLPTGLVGCPKPKPAPKICCLAMKASCLSCSKGITVSEYCANPAWARLAPDCDQYQEKAQITEPRFVTAFSRSTNSATITWTAPAKGFDCSRDRYVVDIRPFLARQKTHGNWRPVTLKDPSDPVAFISGLVPNRKYQLQITPITSTGKGDSAIFEFRTKPRRKFNRKQATKNN